MLLRTDVCNPSTSSPPPLSLSPCTHEQSSRVPPAISIRYCFVIVSTIEKGHSWRTTLACLSIYPLLYIIYFRCNTAGKNNTASFNSTTISLSLSNVSAISGDQRGLMCTLSVFVAGFRCARNLSAALAVYKSYNAIP